MSSAPQAATRPAFVRSSALVWALAALSLGLHLLPRPGYGFHRDELLYLAMGDHLDLFRMQFPPFIALAAQFARALPLELLDAIHLLAGVAAAAVVLLAARIAARLGGSGAAQAITALAVTVTPMTLRAGTLFQPVIFEMLWWSLAVLALVTLLDDGDRRWWVLLGAAAGLAGATKFTALVFGAALAVATLVSPLRRDFTGRWLWVGAGLGALLALPSLTGQIAWGWPVVDQMRVLAQTQLERVTPADFLTGQLLIAGPAAPLLLAGVAAFLLPPLRGRFWPAGVFAVTAAAIFLTAGGKEYYLGPAHPLVIAAGSVALMRWLKEHRAATVVVTAWLGVVGLRMLPIGVPILPPGKLAAYAASVGVTRVVTTNRGDSLPLPQDFADMLGWREQVAAVAEVYGTLDPAERARTMILGGNYGRAGALAVYHREFNLPYPVSRHGDFYNWELSRSDATAVIVVGSTVEELDGLFEEVTVAARVRNPMGVEEEQDVAIHICRLPRKPLRQLWRELGPAWG